MAAVTQTGVFLIKTPQGVTATRSGEGLSEHAVAVLKKFDGSRSQTELKFACKDAGIAIVDFEGALIELLKFEYVRQVDAKTAIAESLKRAEAERRMMQTLDFTMDDDPPPLIAPASPAPAPASSAATSAAISVATSVATKVKPPSVPVAELSAAPVASPVVAPTQSVPDAADEAKLRAEKAAQSTRDADIRSQLIAALQPRVEEELRGKLRARLEEELRPQLMAALRPAIEADVRAALVKELTPRVELELKTRFAKTLMAQKAAAAPMLPAVVESAVEKSPRDDAQRAVFERIFASLDAPLFTLDAKGICTYMSPAWAQLSGYTPKETAGKPLADFFAPDDRRSIGAFFSSMADGSALRFERQAALAVKSGDPRWVEVRAAPLRDAADSAGGMGAGGGAAGVCGLVRDATELKRLVDQAEADSVRLLRLVDQIDTGVILENRDGNIQQVNPAFCAVLALDAAPYSLEGMAVSELFERVSSSVMGGEAFARHIAEMRVAGEDVNGESVIMADGREVRLDYLAVSAGEHIAGRVWLVREAKRG